MNDSAIEERKRCIRIIKEQISEIAVKAVDNKQYYDMVLILSKVREKILEGEDSCVIN